VRSSTCFGRHSSIGAALALLFAVALQANAAIAARLDEAGTVVRDPRLEMRWRSVAPGRSRDETVQGSTTVSVRLNLAAWSNRPARIFLHLAPVTIPVKVSWRGQGRLLPGSMVSGGRALVFQTHAAPQSLEEELVLTVEADGEQLVNSQSLTFSFEIEPQ
jgi:hypothetical protein